MNPDLTLQQIAFEWARELEDERFPGRRSEQQIFANLVSAVRRGEFGSGPFEVQRTSRAKRRRSPGPDGQDIYEINPPYLCSLDDLRKGVWPASGKGGIPWTERDVEDDEPLSVRAFWESLLLSKQKIGPWCDQQDEKRPRFWFGDGRQVRPGRPSGSTAASLDHQKVFDFFDEMARPEQLSFKHGELTSIAAKIAKETGYKADTIRRLIRDKYRELKEKRKAENGIIKTDNSA